MTYSPASRSTLNMHYVFARLADRHSDLLLRHRALLRQSFRRAQAVAPFQIDCICVLPAELRMVCVLPGPQQDAGSHWQQIAHHFARVLPVLPRRTAEQIAKGTYGPWSPNVRLRHVRDVAELMLHRQKVHASPVAANLCRAADDWPASSIHRSRDEQAKTTRNSPDQTADDLMDAVF